MEEKKYRLQMGFTIEERKGFPVKKVFDKIIERDHMPEIIEGFTRGYHENPEWHSLKILVEDRDKEKVKFR